MGKFDIAVPLSLGLSDNQVTALVLYLKVVGLPGQVCHLNLNKRGTDADKDHISQGTWHILRDPPKCCSPTGGKMLKMSWEVIPGPRPETRLCLLGPPHIPKENYWGYHEDSSTGTGQARKPRFVEAGGFWSDHCPCGLTQRPATVE
ncbi:hypothetical protein GWK47_046839 [Chionoecetes opilio]|uniref:Uncharacterized protein n=1 Tax=Chionoecetes opilio TaxID=41210 RepID=A0A8J5CTF9_CHIOP|nr:hypothetical protein GWK47_046839 [Chionoecetes opilio]